MRRVIRLAFLVGLLSGLLVAVTPSQAGGMWHFYVLNNATKQLVRVYLDGTSETFNLPMNPDEYINVYNTAVSPVQSRMAFCSSASGDGVNIPPSTLYIYDVGSPSMTLALPVGNPMACAAASFDSTGQFLALGIANYYEGDPAADTSKPSWQFLILDANTGATVAELNTNSPQVQGLEFMQFGGILPIVPYFEGDNLVFQAMPFGVGGPMTSISAYNWRFLEGTLTPVPVWGSMIQATLGPELVYSTLDPSLPALEQFDMTPPLNAVFSAEKDGSSRLLYTDPDEFITDLEYVQGGGALAIQLTSGSSQGDYNNRWVLLDRSGAVSDMVLTGLSMFPQIRNAEGGYLVFDSAYDEATGNTNYNASAISPGGMLNLWSASTPADQSQGYWELLWAVPAYFPEGAPTFPTAQ